jgi:hypothetical protein
MTRGVHGPGLCNCTGPKNYGAPKNLIYIYIYIYILIIKYVDLQEI